MGLQAPSAEFEILTLHATASTIAVSNPFIQISSPKGNFDPHGNLVIFGDISQLS